MMMGRYIFGDIVVQRRHYFCYAEAQVQQNDINDLFHYHMATCSWSLCQLHVHIVVRRRRLTRYLATPT